MPDDDSATIRPLTRSKHWWVAPLGKSLAVVYAPQLLALVVGPLKECDHCVANFLKFFGVVPGFLITFQLERKLPFSLDEEVTFAVGGTITLVILFGVMMIGSWLKTWKRWLFFLVVGACSAINALIFAAMLRA